MLIDGRARPRLVLARALECAGLVLVVVGSFLPWLRSGDAERDSYAADNALRRLLQPDGFFAAVFRGWPFVGLACAGAIALLLLGSVRAGATLGVLAAACAGGVSGYALAASGSGLVKAVELGPIVTAIGAGLAGLAGIACVIFCPTRAGDRHDQPV